MERFVSTLKHEDKKKEKETKNYGHFLLRQNNFTTFYFCFHIVYIYIDGSRAVYHISLSFRGPQMNRCRLIDEVLVYLQDRSNCHITLIITKRRINDRWFPVCNCFLLRSPVYWKFTGALCNQKCILIKQVDFNSI